MASADAPTRLPNRDRRAGETPRHVGQPDEGWSGAVDLLLSPQWSERRGDRARCSSCGYSW